MCGLVRMEFVIYSNPILVKEVSLKIVYINIHHKCVWW